MPYPSRIILMVDYFEMSCFDDGLSTFANYLNVWWSDLEFPIEKTVILRASTKGSISVMMVN